MGKKIIAELLVLLALKIMLILNFGDICQPPETTNGAVKDVAVIERDNNNTLPHERNFSYDLFQRPLIDEDHPELTRWEIAQRRARAVTNYVLSHSKE